MTEPAELVSTYRRLLFDDVIPFWLRHAMDADGGINTCITDAGEIISRDRWSWSQFRALWVFSALCNHFGHREEWFDAALKFARTEGIVPAPEPTHALAAAIREALACKESGEEKVILTALCGHGHLDLAAYDKYLHGEMVDLELSDEVIEAAMKDVPVLA